MNQPVADVCLEILRDPAGCRAALVSRYPWFSHDTPISNLATIVETGLVAKAVSSCPTEVMQERGAAGHRIICLHPIGAELRPRSSGDGPFCRLALSASELPLTLGLDWSYDWQIARVIRQDEPNKPSGQIVLDVARRRGSIVSYDPIAASKFKVWSDDLPDDPSTWPNLMEISISRVRQFSYA